MNCVIIKGMSMHNNTTSSRRDIGNSLVMFDAHLHLAVFLCPNLHVTGNECVVLLDYTCLCIAGHLSFLFLDNVVKFQNAKWFFLLDVVN